MRSLRFSPILVVFLASALFASDFGRGAKVTVRTETTVRSDQSTFGDPVDVVLVNDLAVNGKVIAPRGSVAHGTVSSVERSVRGKASIPGSISIRLETIDAPEGKYRVTTNPYTREGKGRSNSPFPDSSTGGVTIDSTGGVQTRSPVPTQDDPGSLSVSTGGLEAVIPVGTVITFKASTIVRPGDKP